MSRLRPLEAATTLVAEMFPDAIQAWLAGSVTTGEVTTTSDLDIVVLLGETVVHRQSLVYEDWPVELFVHTGASVRHFVGRDLENRHPTMARMVATGIALLDKDGGSEIRTECESVLARGPGPLTASELDFARYALSDAVDDLVAADPGPARSATAVEVWRLTIELHLATSEWWTGSGKWLVRELAALDAHHHTDWVVQLDGALRAAVGGNPSLLAAAADDVLASAGGRLWAGFRQDADLPSLER